MLGAARTVPRNSSSLVRTARRSGSNATQSPTRNLGHESSCPTNLVGPWGAPTHTGPKEDGSPKEPTTSPPPPGSGTELQPSGGAADSTPPQRGDHGRPPRLVAAPLRCLARSPTRQGKGPRRHDKNRPAGAQRPERPSGCKHAPGGTYLRCLPSTPPDPRALGLRSPARQPPTSANQNPRPTRRRRLPPSGPESSEGREEPVRTSCEPHLRVPDLPTQPGRASRRDKNWQALASKHWQNDPWQDALAPPAPAQRRSPVHGSGAPDSAMPAASSAWAFLSRACASLMQTPPAMPATTLRPGQARPLAR